MTVQKIVSIILTALTCLVLLTVAYACLVLVPKHVQIYAELKIRLPSMTDWLIAACEMGLGYASIGIAVGLIAKEWIIDDPISGAVISGLCLGLALLLAGYIAYALWLPYQEILIGMGSQSR